MESDKEIIPYKMSQPPIIFSGSGKSSNAGMYLAFGVGALVLVGGGFLLLQLFKKKEDITENLTFSVEPLQETVGAGKLCKANVSVTNISEDKTVAPDIRFDIKKGTSGWTTVNENPAGFMPFGDIGPGETVTKEMSMLIPADWGPGVEVYGRVVCLGHEGVVWTDLIATIPSPLSIEMTVVPMQEEVAQGGTAQVNVTLHNPNDSAVELNLALDLKRSGGTWTPAPSEHGGWTPVTIPAGSEISIVLTSEAIGNWGKDTPIAARIQGTVKIAGSWTAQYTAWGSDNNYVFIVGGTLQQTYLHITSPGLAGFEHTCIDIGQTFKYTCSVNNTYSSPLTEVDFIIGWRDSASGTYTENSTTKTIPVGASQVTFLSKVATAAWNDAVVDLRVLVRTKAIIEVTGTTEQADAVAGKVDDKIYEGADVGHIGPSYLANIGGESLVDSMVPADRRVSKLGQAVTFNMRYKHRGPSKSYKCGVWIKDNGTDGGYWIVNTFTAAESPNWVEYEVALQGTFRACPQLKVGQVIDCLFAFMEATVTPAKPPQTQQFLFANWDAILTVK